MRITVMRVQTHRDSQVQVTEVQVQFRFTDSTYTHSTHEMKKTYGSGRTRARDTMLLLLLDWFGFHDFRNVKNYRRRGNSGLKIIIACRWLCNLRSAPNKAIGFLFFNKPVFQRITVIITGF
jgi:hypothetical protein